ncbi:MAG: serine/threonine-protein kinase [Gemmataceae bacterium]
MAQVPPGKSFDEVLDAFEEAWNGAGTPALEEFWKPVVRGTPAGPERRRLLIELIKIDLHHRCQRAEQPRLEDYAARFADLGGVPQLPADLIGEEYSARRLAGAKLEHADYLRRFPAQAGALTRLLPRLDQELAVEATARATPENNAARDVAACLDSLAELGLLDLKKLGPDFHKQFAEREALVRFLARERWLTPYQLEQVARGRPHALAVGPYLLLERIGEGATSVVFRARHRQLDRIVALKVIRKELVRELGPEVIERIYREFRAVGRLDHPNFVHAYDAGPVGATLFIAMEYLEGMNLLQLVKREGRLPVLQACDYVRQACAALQHATASGIVHRDVKPSNLIVSGSRQSQAYPWGLVKLLDLGMARLHHLSHSHQSGMLTHKGSIMGTADYMSPEQAVDAHAADVRADLYSLGCTLYFLLAGRPPFVGGTFVQKIERHRTEVPVSVRHHRPEVPQEIAAVVQRLLAKDPDERYQTPADLYVALGGKPQELPPVRSFDATLEMDGSTLTLAPPASTATARTSPPVQHWQRWRWPALAGGLLVLLLALLPFLLRTDSRQAGPPAAPVLVEKEITTKELAIECGRTAGQVVKQSPHFDCTLVQGTLWDQWQVAPPAKSYCWFHPVSLTFEVTVPPRTPGLLRLHFFDGDHNQRRQQLFVQGRFMGEYADFDTAEKVVDVPLTARDTASGKIEVRIDKVQASNAVVSTIEFYSRQTVRVPGEN